MKVLLDTHAFLWLIAGDPRLSRKAKTVFLDSGNHLFFSAASFWEICIKKSLGKISLKEDWIRTIQFELDFNCIQWLPIEVHHCAEIIDLPFHHRDSFDRMLIGQAIAEDMCLLSRDSLFSSYPVTRIW